MALVSVNTTFNPAIMAGEQSKRLPGRPGGNGITVTKRVVLPEEELEHIKRIGDACGINTSMNIVRAEGYYPPLPDGTAELGDLQFKLGDKPDIEYEASAKERGESPRRHPRGASQGGLRDGVYPFPPALR